MFVCYLYVHLVRTVDPLRGVQSIVVFKTVVSQQIQRRL
jgi:hypothetical protein